MRRNYIVYPLDCHRNYFVRYCRGQKHDLTYYERGYRHSGTNISLVDGKDLTTVVSLRYCADKFPTTSLLRETKSDHVCIIATSNCYNAGVARQNIRFSHARFTRRNSIEYPLHYHRKFFFDIAADKSTITNSLILTAGLL